MPLLPLSLLLALLAAAPVPARPLVYVGVVPPPRAGRFATPVPQGLQDSVRDLRARIGTDKVCALTMAPADAAVRVYLDRRARVRAGTAGGAIGGLALFGPVYHATIWWHLQVGSYQHAFVSAAKSSSWGAAAKAVVKQLNAWVRLNRSQLAIPVP